MKYPPSDVVAGIDLGGTKLMVALADLNGDVLAEEVVPTDPRGGAHVIAQIDAAVERLLRSAGVAREALRCVALGAPGAVDAVSGRLTLAPNIAGFDSIDLQGELERRLETTVVLDNDVNMAVLGEHRFGHGRGRSDLVFVAIGTGIGMGIMSRGEILRGVNGAAGEIAYLPLAADPFAPQSRERGAFELAVAGRTIAERYARNSGARLSVPEVFDLASQAGDRRAQQVLDDEARNIALGIAAVTAVLDPGLVVLGGGIGFRDELLQPVRAWLDRLLPVCPRVETSHLGYRASLVGAIACASQAASCAPRGAPSTPHQRSTHR
jgi:predicted NBD/HSP70 family sugar kinase